MKNGQLTDEIDPNDPLEAFPRRRGNENDTRTAADEHALPSPGGAPNDRLAALAETAKNYARAARANNTQRAYDSDWRHFSSWLRRQGLPQLPPDPQTVGLYLAACADGAGHGAEPTSVATLERRLSGICWHYRQLGDPLDSRDRHIATVLAGIRRQHGRPPVQKEAMFAEELLAMLGVLDLDLRGLRDRAILPSASPAGSAARKSSASIAGPSRPRTEPAGSKCSTAASAGDQRQDRLARSGDRARLRPDTCPVAVLQTWMRLRRIAHGPLFRRDRQEERRRRRRATDRQACCQAGQKCVLKAGVRGDLPEGERKRAFAGHSLRAGLASSAQIEERMCKSSSATPAPK